LQVNDSAPAVTVVTSMAAAGRPAPSR
jgi:hypothetical protein